MSADKCKEADSSTKRIHSFIDFKLKCSMNFLWSHFSIRTCSVQWKKRRFFEFYCSSSSSNIQYRKGNSRRRCLISISNRNGVQAENKSLSMYLTIHTPHINVNHLNINMEINPTRSSLLYAWLHCRFILGLKGEFLLLCLFFFVFFYIFFYCIAGWCWCGSFSWLLLIDFCGTWWATK